MGDKEFIDKVAQLWIALDGDAEGVQFLWGDLRDRVTQLTKEKEE